MPAPYAPQGPGTAPFSPSANQFTPFANQFGNLGMGMPWSVPPGMAQYQQADPLSVNYAVGPAASAPSPALNQQATSFTPRAMGQGQRQNQRQGQAPGTNGHGHGVKKQDQDLESLEDQLRRFKMNQRPQ
jgi:hypothetical protein